MAAGPGSTHRYTLELPKRTDNDGETEGTGARRRRARLRRAQHTTTSDAARHRALRNTDNPGLYYGYFENRYGEQFVFTFDRATGTGTVSGGDLGWGDPRPFTLGQLEEAVRDTQGIASEAEGKVRLETSGLPTIDAALVLGGSPP